MARTTPDQRSPYHHGDLRAALVEAGLELTRTGGPAALGMREVARRVGVSPNAAYRHVADRRALLDAVAEAILDRMAARMTTHHRQPGASAELWAVEQLHAVGLAYIRFALAEPGWFAVAFFGETDAGPSGPSKPADAEPVRPAPPFVRLAEALDGLVDAGALDPRQRVDAEWPCFAAVHGFAELALHGPLRHSSRDVLDRLAVRTVADIVAGVVPPQSNPSDGRPGGRAGSRLGEQADWEA